jgi:L1 cell adhesion molecule like protein
MKSGMSLEEVSAAVVESYVHLRPSTSSHSNTNCVYNYACEFLTLGLLWLIYYDAIKEGDGLRIMKLFKYFLLIF